MKFEAAKKWKLFLFLAVFTGVIIFLNGYNFLGISHWGTFTAALFALIILTGYISILFSKRNSFTSFVAKFLDIF